MSASKDRRTDDPDLLLKEQKLRGWWWLAERPDSKVAGTLEFVPFDGIGLDLLGQLGGGAFEGTMLEREVLLGQTEAGKPVTLVNAFENKRQHSSAGTGTSAWVVNLALLGKHCGARSDIRFDYLGVRFTALEEWAGHQPFGPEPSDKIRTSVSYEKPTELDTSLPGENCVVTLTSARKEQFDRREVSIGHAAYFKLAPNKPRGLQWFLDTAHHLQNLLILLQGQHVVRTRMKADGTDIILAQEGKGVAEPPMAHEMLFPLAEIREALPQILEKWFATTEALRPVHSLLFSSYYNPSMYREVRFLNLTQALECYHRRRCKGTYVSSEDYERCRRRMFDAIPSDAPTALKQRLNATLKHGNEYSQRKRFKDLINSMGEKARRLITQDGEGFVSRIVDIRNYYTHYVEELEDAKPETVDVIYLSWRLRAWLVLLVLRDLGIEEDHIVQRMQAVRRWQYYLSHEA